MAGALSSWPWESLGAYKYYMLGPFVGNVIYSRMQEGVIKESWCLHIIILWAIRIYMYHLWTHYVSMLFFTRNRIIDERGVDFDQIDREWDWDNFMLLQTIMGAIACNIFPFISNVPLWDSRGFIVALLLHMALSEPIYYYVHKCFHGRYLFKHYHSIHHSSTLPQPYTAGYGSFLEHIILCGIIGIPIIGTCFMGYGSKTMIYGYLLLFDFMRSLGHSNVEIIPHQLYEALPFMRYLLYTPTYHSLHHKEQATNYCLFMPLYDALGNTLNTNSWELHKKMSLKSGKNSRVPDFVFLAHAVDITTSLHSPSSLRGFASMPFKMRWFLIVVWPLGFIVMLIMWAKSKVFLYSFYNLRGRLHQTWVVPRYGFQYFLPFCKKGINMQIEEAILRADRLGVKVLSLAALNKNEALNGGGTLFVEKFPDLKVRVVHGNTLTAAVILNEITDDVEEVFLTGATSKLGRAIALYLCKKRVRVLMLTVSTERFEKIKKEAPIEYQKYLVQVTKYQAAQNCKTWIVGKWITPREQSWAPSGTQFHQFVVPPIFSFRSDCTYGDLAAMRLPDDVQGLGCCEYTLERGVVHACHAGGVVHFLEGWTHHEVGAIDVAQIDIVWAAALKHGLKPVSSFPKHKQM